MKDKSYIFKIQKNYKIHRNP